MIVSLKVICLIVAVVLFALATFFALWVPTSRFNLVAGGLFFYALKDMLP